MTFFIQINSFWGGEISHVDSMYNSLDAENKRMVKKILKKSYNKKAVTIGVRAVQMSFY